MSEDRRIELEVGILDKNDRLAADLRQRFAASGVLAVNLMSGPGTGKTALLEVLLTRMATPPPHGAGVRVAALVGDCATDHDARRLSRSGAPVRQIVTHGLCHLEADLVERHLEGWDLDELDVLFVENVGNLVCPTGFDLGEGLRVVLLSVTEGEDKPLKYPQIFVSADVAVLTKIDLADAAGFDRDAAMSALEAVHPGLPVVATSARTGAGIDDLIGLLAAHRRAAPGAPGAAIDP